MHIDCRCHTAPHPGGNDHYLWVKGEVTWTQLAGLTQIELVTPLDAQRVGVYPIDSDEPFTHAFQAIVFLWGLPETYTIEVFACLDEGGTSKRVKLTEVPGRRQRFEHDGSTDYLPLMLMSFGRSGSSVMMKMLIEHPKIVGVDVFPYETRLAAYQTNLFLAGTSPAREGSWLRRDVLPRAKPARIGFDPAFEPYVLSHAASAEFQRHFFADRLDRAARHALASIDGSYNALNKPTARFFAEKLHPGPIPLSLDELYQGRGKKVVLVRDFRDMIASIISFNAKRGNLMWGQPPEPDEAWIKHISRRVAALQDAVGRYRPPIVHYEDLMGDPVGTARRLFRQLGLSTSRKVLARCTQHIAHPDSSRATGHVTSQGTSVGRWQRDLSPDLQRWTNHHFRDALQTFGYDVSKVD